MKISYFLAKYAIFQEFSYFSGIKRYWRSNVLTDSYFTSKLAIETTRFVPDLQKKKKKFRYAQL